MENENRKDRIIRIIKTLMYTYGYNSVQKFADDIGANYMQVYYCYIGKTTSVSSDLEEKIISKLKDVNPEFIRTGFGPVKGGEEIPVPLGEKMSKTDISPNELYSLLDRVTTLLEKVQAREDYLIRRMEELKRKEEELDYKIKSLENNKGSWLSRIIK